MRALHHQQVGSNCADSLGNSVGSGLCKHMALEVHPLGRMLELKGMGRVAIPYLGYIEVNLQIPSIRGYSKDVLMLVIPTMTYTEKVPVVVGSKIIHGAMKVITKEELVRQQMCGGRPTSLWSCLGHSSCPKNAQGGRALPEGHPLLQTLAPPCIRNSVSMTSMGTSALLMGSQSLHLGL